MMRFFAYAFLISVVAFLFYYYTVQITETNSMPIVIEKFPTINNKDVDYKIIDKNRINTITFSECQNEKLLNQTKIFELRTLKNNSLVATFIISPSQIFDFENFLFKNSGFTHRSIKDNREYRCFLSKNRIFVPGNIPEGNYKLVLLYTYQKNLFTIKIRKLIRRVFVKNNEMRGI